MSKMGWFGGNYSYLRSPEIAPIDRAHTSYELTTSY